MFELDTLLSSKEKLEVENMLLGQFGDKFLEDAVRIISTRTVTPFDDELVYEAICIILAIYTRKIHSGEINRVLH
jgi:hypothetical protein